MREPGREQRADGGAVSSAIIGDHVKTAICTRIMTGAVIHTGAMLAQAAAVTGCVPGFAWWTDAQRKTYRLDKFMEVVKAAMGRRKVSPTEAYVERLNGLHVIAATRGRRRVVGCEGRGAWTRPV